jgi:hypothetical protein
MLTSMMVGLAGQDLVGAEELLEQHDTGELVGQGHGTEGEQLMLAGQGGAVRATDDEAHVEACLPAFLQEPRERFGVIRGAVAVEQDHVGPIGDAAPDLLVHADLDQLHPGVAGEQLAVVRDVVGVGRTQPPDREHDVPHVRDTTSGMGDDERERHINIHTSPEIMAGVYANFANVSHSDYEFTITFARVDHEVEEDEIPGVVVSRINLSARFMRELIDAMDDNYSKWSTREGIKNLPEFGERRHGTGGQDATG